MQKKTEATTETGKAPTASKRQKKGKEKGKGKRKLPPKKPVEGETGAEGTKIPFPESLKKKARINAELRLAEINQKKLWKKKRAEKRKEIFKRAQKYAAEYKAKARHLLHLKRTARKAGIFYVEPEAKVALIIRIKGIMGVSPKVRKVLQLLRLRQINNAVFVKINKPILQMLKIAEPYITWGYPTFKTIRALFYKRGFVKYHGQRIPITSNDIISRSLAKFNIICAEDLIHEIYTCGPHFKKANNFLWPFKLSNPTGGWVKKNIHFAEGGDAGNREYFINRLFKQMN